MTKGILMKAPDLFTVEIALCVDILKDIIKIIYKIKKERSDTWC